MYRESASRSWSSNHEIYLFDTRKVVSQALRERSNNGGRQQELELCIYFARSRSELERGDGYRLETNTRRIRSFPIFQILILDIPEGCFGHRREGIRRQELRQKASSGGESALVKHPSSIIEKELDVRNSDRKLLTEDRVYW
ncbi:uncharacterized protein LOC143143484 isoform X1 [Ptiloglossa arizonensis]|uniref:uncharacterized protein LOC143143484 isoform X1 n=1 Tax=Ptiloglossa arizonensis TaxID=3350558 RepID=UPI003F9F8BE6